MYPSYVALTFYFFLERREHFSSLFRTADDGGEKMHGSRACVIATPRRLPTSTAFAGTKRRQYYRFGAAKPDPRSFLFFSNTATSAS